MLRDVTQPAHAYFMTVALEYAKRGLGHTAPNPSVGCVIVENNRILAAATTARGGRPHAEPLALEAAGALAKGATAYVTLEPCAHEGETPSCAKTLIEAGIAKVVIANTDPDPRTAGKGIQMLRDAGIEVITDICEEEARTVHKGFFLKLNENRPFITLKCAISADGKIAEAIGKRTQISGELASRYMHLLRSQHDAILVGQMTDFVDKPKLTTRIQGYEHESLRVILDSGVQTKAKELAEQGITRLLVEGGAKTHTSFIKTGLYDEIHLIKSPKILGEQGVDSADFQAISNISLVKTRALGEDTLEIYKRDN